MRMCIKQKHIAKCEFDVIKRLGGKREKDLDNNEFKGIGKTMTWENMKGQEGGVVKK